MDRCKLPNEHQNMHKPGVKIHLSELQPGMFVSSLECDWLETPFLMQGLVIKSQADIDALAKYTRYVWIDPERQEFHPGIVNQSITRSSAISKVAATEKSTAGTERAAAVSVYREARRLTKTLLEDARIGGVIDSESARVTVKECVSSILRNPDALLWMSRMRNEDEYTSEHCLNVCILAIAFGRHLGFNEAELEQLGMCGLLHDVGKMRVPNDILNKPGKLTAKEYRMIKAHPVHGRNLLMSSPGVDQRVIDVAYSHHERIDGEGYPRKLNATDISEFSRIIAIVDAYDAMTANRCYSRAIPCTEALKNIFTDRNTHFDEHLALEFIKSVGLYPPGSIVELLNGLVAIVLETNYRYRHLPKVLVVHDLNNPLEEKHVLHLADVTKGKLDESHLVRRALCDGSHDIYLRDYRDQAMV